MTSEFEFQLRLLAGVSRSFAFTIPQLPIGLRAAAANSYLLCRIADTIEDDPSLTPREKDALSARYADVVAGQERPDSLARDLCHRLSESTPAAERELIEHLGDVIAINDGLRKNQRLALIRCVQIMTSGMAEFQQVASLEGLRDLHLFDRYCYHVAGVVGDTLSELFCDYSARISDHRNALFALSASFGQGLQMVNILKDMWDDRQRGVCWLPSDVFADVGLDLAHLQPGNADQALIDALAGMLAIARCHVENGLRYVALLPAFETGIRRYCLWSLGMAGLTLQRIQATPGFTTGQDVKISRQAVKSVIVSTSVGAPFNPVLRLLFMRFLADLPRPSSARPLVRHYCETIGQPPLSYPSWHLVEQRPADHIA